MQFAIGASHYRPNEAYVCWGGLFSGRNMSVNVGVGQKSPPSVHYFTKLKDMAMKNRLKPCSVMACYRSGSIQQNWLSITWTYLDVPEIIGLMSILELSGTVIWKGYRMEISKHDERWRAECSRIYRTTKWALRMVTWPISGLWSWVVQICRISIVFPWPNFNIMILSGTCWVNDKIH